MVLPQVLWSVAIYVIAIQFTKIYRQFATSVYNITFPMLNRLVNNKASNSVILTEVIKISRTQLIVLLLIFSGFVLGKILSKYGQEMILNLLII